MNLESREMNLLIRERQARLYILSTWSTGTVITEAMFCPPESQSNSGNHNR